MNQQLQDFPALKNELELSLARTILTQLDTGAITHGQSQQISQYILARIDEAVDPQGILLFLQDLSQKWNMFETLFNFFKIKVADTQQTDVKLEEVKQNLSVLNNT